ncbi:MAG TPA: ABC transporter transmembrane domain-containing protein [Caulobacteraceae bacterium]|nr:ABC transporter transmembrane domain-containing protein [Caulobacteraceae bacterium]
MSQARSTSNVAPEGLRAVVTEALATDAWRRPLGRDLKPLARLWPLVTAHWLDALLGMLFLLLSTGALLALTGGPRMVIDQGFRLHTRAALEQVFLILGATAGFLAVTTGLRLYFTYKLGERIIADLRQQVFRHILGLDMGHFTELRTGELLSRLTTDMTIVEGTVGIILPGALRNLLTVAGALIWMVLVSPNFTGLILVLIPLLLTPLFLVGRRIQRLSTRAQDRFAEAVGHAGEGLEAIDTVQAFGQEDSIAARFNLAIERAFLASRARLRVSGLMSGLMISLIFAGMLILLYECALAVIVRHSMQPGALFQLLVLAFVAATGVRDLSEVWSQIQRATGAAERIVGMMETRPAIAAPARPTPMPSPPRGEITMDNVSFAYPQRDGLALDGFSLAISPGERVALVGPSGAGKSTVFRLLLRFYDPHAGQVAIDGVDLRNADPRAVRARVAFVAQDAPLFSSTVAENIAFGARDAQPAEIMAAAIAAQVEGFLTRLPHGIDTLIGERAKLLSGGQRQRIAIARALVRKAPILLLDEATSALDAESERLVQAALHEAMEGRTTLVIAHRLATVLEADRIIVMEAGKVVEAGRHTELMARGGLYARLARLQFGAAAA